MSESSPRQKFDHSALLHWAILGVFLVGGASPAGCKGRPAPPPITQPTNLDVDPLITSLVTREANRAQEAPGDPEKRSRLAFAYDTNGLARLAQTEYEALMKLDPADPLWPYRRALCLIELGNRTEGEQGLQSVTEQFPDFSPAWHQLSLLRLGRGDLEAARVAIDRCLALSPRSVPARITRAEVHVRAGKTPLAISLLEEVVGAEPENNYARFLLGSAYQRSGRRDAEVDSMLAEGLGAKNGRVEDPRENLLRALKTGLSHEVDRGISLIRAGRPADATRILEAALSAHPTDAIVMSNLAQAKNNAGDSRGALAMISKAIEADPQNFRVHLARGKIALSVGDAVIRSSNSDPRTAQLEAREYFETALAATSRAARLAPNEWLAHFDYARAAQRCGQSDLARTVLQEAYRLSPDNTEVNQFMFELAWQSNDQEVAVAALERVVAVDPQHLASWVNLVHTRTTLEDWEAAKFALSKARAIDAAHPRVVNAATKLREALAAKQSASEKN